MKRDLYLEVGGFDEDYFMYGEDIDLSYRLLNKGLTNYYFGRATVLHYKGESTLKDALYARRFYGAMQMFYKKHFRKNIFFDLAVWIGLKVAFFMRKQPPKRRNPVQRYHLLTNRNPEALIGTLNKPVVCSETLQHETEFGTEIIFDQEFLSFQQMFEHMVRLRDIKGLSFKILPKKVNFIIGSDDSINKGEVISWDE